MRKILFLIGFISMLSGCWHMEATIPPGHQTLCNKDPDCFEGQHCGFVYPYTVAVCKGYAVSNFPALNYPSLQPR